MKQILKYIIYIIIGIILYLLYNSYNTFSVGIPFRCDLLSFKNSSACREFPFEPEGHHYNYSRQNYVFDDIETCNIFCENLIFYRKQARTTGGRRGQIRKGGKLPTTDAYTLDQSNVIKILV